MKRPAVFFDRDNTLIACDGYLGDPAKVVLIDGAAKAVARVRELGFAAVVFSNQSGVARGMFGEDAVHAVNHRLDDLLHEDDPRAVIDRHDFCPYHPSAKVERYRIDSDLRKPKPGMIYQAEKALGLDLPRSWVVGDAPRDIAAGHAAGLRTVLLKIASLPPSPATSEGAGVEPTFVASSLAEAMDFIERHAKLDTAPNKPKEAAADDSERVFEDETVNETDTADAGNQKHDAPSPVPDDSREDDKSAAAEASVADAPMQVAEDSAPSSAELKTEPDSPASVAATLVVPEPSQPERSSATEAATSSPPDRAEDTVKLTPRPNIKPDANKPIAEPAKPAATSSGTEAAKPVQGGFVVKPNQAPRMTWGERMRVAKSGGTFTPPGSSTPVAQVSETATPPAPAATTPTTTSEDETPAAVEEVTAELVTESSPGSTERVMEASPAMAMIVADSPTSTSEPKRGQRREDSGEAGGLAEERSSSDDRGAAARSDGVTREPGVDDAPATAARRRSAVGDSSRTEELLEQILVELRRREEQGSLDFSVSKLLAGITQVLALAALFFAYLNQDKGTVLQSTLLLALTLQTLTISLLIMGKQK